jgi:hypothetical protein
LVRIPVKACNFILRKEFHIVRFAQLLNGLFDFDEIWQTRLEHHMGHFQLEQYRFIIMYVPTNLLNLSYYFIL